MAAEVPTEPVFFLKPDSALLQRQMPFFYPDFSHEVQYELEIVVRIDKVGKCIEERFAHRYYNAVALGIDFTARDLQRTAKQQGLPWTVSKGFDASAALSEFIPLSSLDNDINHLSFSLQQNGTIVQQGNSADMLFGVDRLISSISRYMTLRTGDLIFTGTPAGVGSIAIGDTLVGILEDKELLTCRIK